MTKIGAGANCGRGSESGGEPGPQDEASAADLGGGGAAELWDHGGTGGVAWRSGDAALGFCGGC